MSGRRGVPQPETLAVVLGHAEIVQAVGNAGIIIQDQLSDLLQQLARGPAAWYHSQKTIVKKSQPLFLLKRVVGLLLLTCGENGNFNGRHGHAKSRGKHGHRGSLLQTSDACVLLRARKSSKAFQAR